MGPAASLPCSCGPSTLKMRKKISQGLIEVGESLVNTLSERARLDTLQKAEDEVRRAEARLRQSLVDLRRFRDEEGSSIRSRRQATRRS